MLSDCGDGATSKGDFYESLNLAGVWQLPVVFLVCNNQWAISVPRHKQTASQTIAQKAMAAGIPGEQVDGNDIFALYHCLHSAIEKVRMGKGPRVIEALTYRLGDHTTADDAQRYQPEEDVKQAWQQEPIKRLRNYLINHCLWDQTQEDELIAECQQEIQQAVETYQQQPAPKPEDMFDYLFAEMPEPLYQQREDVIAKALDNQYVQRKEEYLKRAGQESGRDNDMPEGDLS